MYDLQKEGSKFYVWIFMVATHPCGGYGGPPLRKFRNMKCSRSDSRPIFHKESKIKLFFHDYIVTPTTLLVVNAFTTNTSWTQPVRFESLMLVFCMETVNCLLIAALLDRC